MADALRALAMDAVEQAKSGHPGMPMGMADIAAVLFTPCWRLFEGEPETYREAVLEAVPRVAVEAAVGFGWERWLGTRGAFVGATGSGASAPGEALYRHYGITAERVAAAVRSVL
jgi:transketolase